MARQENIRLLSEQVRLAHLMVEAAGSVMEVLVGEEVDVSAALGVINLGNLGRKCQHYCGDARGIKTEEASFFFLKQNT